MNKMNNKIIENYRNDIKVNLNKLNTEIKYLCFIIYKKINNIKHKSFQYFNKLV